MSTINPPLADHFAPRFPQKLEELDVNTAFLTDLALKTMAADADCTTASIAARLRLGMLITEPLLKRLYNERFIETKGVIGLHNQQYAMLDRGWDRNKQLLDLCSYVGPAPVSLAAYTELIASQARSRPPITRSSLNKALAGLVLADDVKESLGLVASSGRSLFLSGPSGNGKTAMAHALADAIEGTLWMPYAIEVDGHVIRMFDAHTHHKVADAGPDVDRRWVKMRTPFVVAGGELTLTDLDLYRTDTPRFYEAPFQMKSNGGVLLIDDLGRQRCSAKQLLNRWIIPLENHVDYLTLSTGQKIQVPFEQLVVFATNLTEPDLADEAFLRRMGYRLYVSAPSVETYTEIFQHCAKSFNLPVAPEIIDRLLACYRADKRIMKCCEPRDLILRSVEVCKYRQQAPRLDPELLAVAWKSYFGTAANLH